jgi:hypothetical protein
LPSVAPGTPLANPASAEPAALWAALTPRNAVSIISTKLVPSEAPEAAGPELPAVVAACTKGTTALIMGYLSFVGFHIEENRNG